MSTTTHRGLGRFQFAVFFAMGCAGTSSPVDQPALRVGTTGDFPPFSIASGTGFLGIDVDLARDFGRSVGRSVEFVSTSWPTLEADAANDRFDIAMSGISIIAPRAMNVAFSMPYAEHQRIAIVRCAEAHLFSSLLDLDRDGVTVSVPHGGAVASYARGHLINADVVEIDSDAMPTAYRQLADGDGDAIISTPYTFRRYPGLCIGLAGRRFFSTPIAVVVPRGSDLLEAVNSWLATRLADRTVAGILAHYRLGGDDGP